jgi:hypothetical protein
VLKPGGQIILVNHLYSEMGVAAAIERWLRIVRDRLACVEIPPLHVCSPGQKSMEIFDS